MNIFCCWNIRKHMLSMLFFIFCALLLSVESRPFFNSRFYMDEHRLSSHHHQDAEMRFVSFDRERKTLVERKIDLSRLNHNPVFDEFRIVPFLDDLYSMRRRFAILRHQSNEKYRGKPSHGITGLWG